MPIDMEASQMHALALNVAATQQRSFTMVEFDNGEMLYSAAFKLRGQLAYEEDLKRTPTYHDGSLRPSWKGLSSVAKWSWNRMVQA